MKRVKELLSKIEVKRVLGDDSQEIRALEFDSRRVAAGVCFFALRGTSSDGHSYIGRAVEAGALCVVCEELPEEIYSNVCYVEVEDSTLVMAKMAAEFYDNPSKELKVVGVTGTNGKTTTATLLCDLMQAMGHPSGLISTVIYRVGSRTIPSTHTTPDAIRLQSMFREMVDAGCTHCFMEVSSHSIAQQRIAGIEFSGAIFTNLTHDHLDYHKSFAEYLRVKKMLFDNLPKSAFALVNIDDKNGRVMVQNTKAKVYTLSLRSMAEYRCRIIEMLFDGMLLKVGEDEVWVHQPGRFNAYNLLSVYAAAELLGCDGREALRVLSTLKAVDGRFEVIRAKDGRVAIVDYAHTPDALENVILTIEEIRRPEQQLFVLCGCGGERDRTKRPEMARIAINYSSTAIFTSDNPRHEDPEAILDEMTEGLDGSARYLRIADRRQAIRSAVMLSKPNDIILVAGKGHEDYQIVGDQKLHFDDREEVKEAFSKLG